MDIQTRKIEFVQEFLKLQSEEAISKFEKLLKNSHIKESNLDVEPMSIAELNKRIDKSEKDFKNDNYKSTSELLSKY